MNSPAPHRGKIFLYKKFPHNDGGQSDKFLIVVNEPDSLSDWIFVKTTSKPKPKHNPKENQGCYSDHSLYVFNANEDYFPKKTWVQFHEIHCIPKLALDAASRFGDLKRVGGLKKQSICAILNCIKKSPDLAPVELSLLK